MLFRSLNAAHAAFEALNAERRLASARLVIAETEQAEADVIARFKAATEDLKEWSRLYDVRKKAALALLDVLGIEPSMMKYIL